MAYSKLIVVGPDYAVGYQSVNQARDNLDAQFDAMKLQHGTLVPLSLKLGQSPPPGVKDLGHHNDERIPRDSIFVSPRLNGYVTVVDQTTSRTIGSGIRTAVGLFSFAISGLVDFYGVAAVKSNSPRVALCSRVDGTNYLQVQIFSCSVDPLAGLDVPFTLTVYGTPT